MCLFHCSWHLHGHLRQSRESSGAFGECGAEGDSRPAKNHPDGCLWPCSRGARKELQHPRAGHAGSRGMRCREKKKAAAKLKWAWGGIGSVKVSTVGHITVQDVKVSVFKTSLRDGDWSKLNLHNSSVVYVKILSRKKCHRHQTELRWTKI